MSQHTPHPALPKIPLFCKSKKEATRLECALLLHSPARADLVAALGETTGERALRSMRARMQASATGRIILEERPRITASTSLLVPVDPTCHDPNDQIFTARY